MGEDLLQEAVLLLLLLLSLLELGLGQRASVLPSKFLSRIWVPSSLLRQEQQLEDEGKRARGRAGRPQVKWF